MRTLKLQMLITLDGFGIEPPDGDGQAFVWDDEMEVFSVENLKNVDRIVLGRKTADDFIPYWKKVSEDPGHKEYPLGRPLTDIPKTVFSTRPPDKSWSNTTVVAGDIVTEIEQLKNEPGEEMIVYGGYSFVSALIRNRLIDTYYLLVHPLMMGRGQRIQQNLQRYLKLDLQQCRAFPGGVVLLHYTQPKA